MEDKIDTAITTLIPGSWPTPIGITTVYEDIEIVNWRALLIKYARHVGESEGVDFIPHDWDSDPCGTHLNGGQRQECGFTPAELVALLEIRDEA